MTIAVNALQMLAALCVVVLVIVKPEVLSVLPVRLALAVLTMIVIWGAYIDIREALAARRLYDKADMMENSLDHLESLNDEMRKQRHDFMNHLQVVYSLAELQETNETLTYIERVYGDLRKVGRLLKTAFPSVNALLAAKESAAEERNVHMETVVQSSLEGIPVEDWEICRVLGNLIDNAFDALEDSNDNRSLTVKLSEDAKNFMISIKNNGPEIPPEVKERMFEERFSTKGGERGMGLAIVREIIENAGGTIDVESDQAHTVFRIEIPKKKSIAI